MFKAAGRCCVFDILIWCFAFWLWAREKWLLCFKTWEWLFSSCVFVELQPLWVIININFGSERKLVVGMWCLRFKINFSTCQWCVNWQNLSDKNILYKPFLKACLPVDLWISLDYLVVFSLHISVKHFRSLCANISNFSSVAVSNFFILWVLFIISYLA